MDKKNLAQLPENGEKAYRKIRERIKEGTLLLDRQIDSDEELEEAEADFNSWSKHNEMILSLLFDDSLIVNEYTKLHHDVTPRPSYDSQSLIHDFPRLQHQIRQSYVRQYRKEIDTQIKYLQRIGDQLEFRDKPSYTLPSPFGNDVFIMPGGDEEAKYVVTSFVEKLGLTATILGDYPYRALTLTEKFETFTEAFEKYSSNAGFVIVLFTAQDMFNLRDEIWHRTRTLQNVFLELGYVMGKLGRERVCLLLKGEIELPLDVDGTYVHKMDGNGAWKLKLAQEMKYVGLPVDLNEVL